MTIAKMRANPIERVTHECHIVDGRGMQVLPRVLPGAAPALPFSSYRGLISRAPPRWPDGPDAASSEDDAHEP
jgi:hypothetical protein